MTSNDAILDALKRLEDGQESLREEMTRRLEDGRKSLLEEMTRRLEDGQKSLLEEMTRRLEDGQKSLEDGQKSLREEMIRGFQRVHSDLSVLKGDYAWVATGRQMHLLAASVDCEAERVLTRNEIDALSRRLNMDIPRSEQDSFGEADYIVRAVNNNGRLCYLVIEVSFTVDAEDIRRAVRNARYITDLTRTPGYPVVAGLRKDNNADTGDWPEKARWYQLRQDA